MKLRDKVRALFPNTAERVSAACAIVGILVSLPAACVSIQQARSSREEANAARDAAESTKEQLRLAQQQLKISEQNLAEMRGMASVGRDSLLEARKSAAATARVADEAAAQASSAKQSANAASSIARAQDTLAQLGTRTRSDTMRPALLYTNMSYVSFAAEAPLRYKLNFKNHGRGYPRKLRSWGGWRVYNGTFETPRAPACASNWDTLAMTGEEMTVTFDWATLTRESYDNVTGGSSSLVIYGALCYEDDEGKPHRTDYCIKRSGPSNNFMCRGIADPT